MFRSNVPFVTIDPTIVKIVVTSAKIDGVEQTDDYRLVIPKGGVTELTFELHDTNGNKLPVTDNFAVPIGILNGAVADTLLLSFVDGVGSLTETWNTSGEFVITKELLNTYIDNTQVMYDFRGMVFSVYRVGA
jgi:hypothetical protein